MDAIDRQAAIKAVGDYEKVKIAKGLVTPEKAVVVLAGLPAADVVEVVRCKDCKHYQFADNRAFGMPVKMCEWFGFEDVDDDDENEWLLLAECICMNSTIKLASFDTEDEAKRMLMDIAHGWKHNYPIFYCGEKE